MSKMVMGIVACSLAGLAIWVEDVFIDNAVEVTEADARFGVTSEASVAATVPASRESASATIPRALVLRTVTNP